MPAQMLSVILDEKNLLITIDSCPRCECRHARLPIEELMNPTDDWDAFAICPHSEHPILVFTKKEAPVVACR